MKRWLSVLCLLPVLLLCLPTAIAADGCFVLDVDALDLTQLNNNAYVQQYLSAQTQGLRVRRQLPQGQSLPVRLSLTQMDTQTLIFDKDYGSQSGLFDSGSIYLPYVGNLTVPYLVTLYVGDTVYAIPFMHLQARLKSNGACTYGAYLYDYNPALGQDWHMATMLDMNALRNQGVLAVDLCASNCYLIGQVSIVLQGSAICVIPAPDPAANVEILSQEVYVATDCSRLLADGWGKAYQPGEWIEVGGADSVLLYLPMTISYDPSGLSTFTYNLNYGYLEQQLQLWQQNCGLE